MLLSFVQLGLILILFALFMVVAEVFLVKFIVKTAPKDVQEIIYKRPPQPVGKTSIGIVLACIIIAGKNNSSVGGHRCHKNRYDVYANFLPF